jgi:hypothetical protein
MDKIPGAQQDGIDEPVRIVHDVAIPIKAALPSPGALEFRVEQAVLGALQRSTVAEGTGFFDS